MKEKTDELEAGIINSEMISPNRKTEQSTKKRGIIKMLHKRKRI